MNTQQQPSKISAGAINAGLSPEKEELDIIALAKEEATTEEEPEIRVSSLCKRKKIIHTGKETWGPADDNGRTYFS